MARRLVPICALAVLVTAGCGAGGKHVALPPASASPKQIVKAYIAALNAHDLATARALLTPTHAQVVQGAVDSWFRNVVSITHLQMNKPFSDRYDARHLQYRSCVGMGVNFVLEQHQVMSMPNGHTTWGYILCRDKPSERWRIADEGTG